MSFCSEFVLGCDRTGDLAAVTLPAHRNLPSSWALRYTQYFDFMSCIERRSSTKQNGSFERRRRRDEYCTWRIKMIAVRPCEGSVHEFVRLTRQVGVEYAEHIMHRVLPNKQQRLLVLLLPRSSRTSLGGALLNQCPLHLWWECTKSSRRSTLNRTKSLSAGIMPRARLLLKHWKISSAVHVRIERVRPPRF